MMQVRAMSVEPAGWNDELPDSSNQPGSSSLMMAAGPGGSSMVLPPGAGSLAAAAAAAGAGSSGVLMSHQMLQDRPHVAAPDPAVSTGTGHAVEQELGAALDPNWSYQAPSHLEQGILQLRQQQLLLQQAQAQALQMQAYSQHQQQQQAAAAAAAGGYGSRSFDTGVSLLQGPQQQAVAAGNSADGAWLGLQLPAAQQQLLQQQQQQQQAGRRASMMMVDLDEGPQR
jgi:hypothetical protein